MISIQPLLSSEFTVDLIDPICAEVAASVPPDRGKVYDPEYFSRQWRTLMDAGLATTWAARYREETLGILGALEMTDIFSGTVMMMEQFWFVKSEWRGGTVASGLFKTFEEHARNRGVTSIWAGSNHFNRPEKRKRVYEAWGFEEWGHNFRKLLK